jgi:hypothetical protein
MKNILSTLIFIMGFSSSVSAQIPSYIPKDSLVGWWPFNGNANDGSGKGNNGTTVGAKLSNDRANNQNSCYYFGGTDYITLSKYPTSGTESFSIFSWIKSPNSASIRQIISYGSNTSGKGLWFFIGSDNLLHFDLSYTPGATSTDIVGDDKWHFVGITNKAGKIQLYIDGQQSGVTKSMSPDILTGGAAIGSSIIHDNFYYQGSIDEIGIWNRALDSIEIKSIFNSCPKKITSEPQSITTTNRFATFSCNANDTLQSFQWQKSMNGTWTNLKDSGQYSGCKTNKLIVNHILKLNNNDQFRCQIKGNCINTFTQAASLNFNCKIVQTNKPKNYGLFGGNAIFVSNNNDTLVNYQWQTNQGTGWNNLFNAGQFSGVNNDTLIVENVSTSNNGQLFRCIMQGDCGKDTSIEAKLSVWGVNTNSINKQAFMLSPNPVKDILNVHGIEPNAYYQITNSIGQIYNQGNFQDKLDVSALKSGIYIFKTEAGTLRFTKE